MFFALSKMEHHLFVNQNKHLSEISLSTIIWINVNVYREM